MEEISMHFAISTGGAHTILVEALGISKICSSLIPHCLSSAQKDKRVNFAKNLLAEYEHADPRSLSEIITSDESWI